MRFIHHNIHRIDSANGARQNLNDGMLKCGIEGICGRAGDGMAGACGAAGAGIWGSCGIDRCNGGLGAGMFTGGWGSGI